MGRTQKAKHSKNEEQHDHNDNLNSSPYKDCQESRPLRSPKDISVCLLPATFFSDFFNSFLVNVIFVQVFPYSPLQNVCYHSCQEQDHQSWVDDAESMDLVFIGLHEQIQVSPARPSYVWLLKPHRVWKCHFSQQRFGSMFGVSSVFVPRTHYGCRVFGQRVQHLLLVLEFFVFASWDHVATFVCMLQAVRFHLEPHDSSGGGRAWVIIVVMHASVVDL